MNICSINSMRYFQKNIGDSLCCASPTPLFHIFYRPKIFMLLLKIINLTIQKKILLKKMISNIFKKKLIIDLYIELN